MGRPRVLPAGGRRARRRVLSAHYVDACVAHMTRRHHALAGLRMQWAAFTLSDEIEMPMTIS